MHPGVGECEWQVVEREANFCQAEKGAREGGGREGGGVGEFAGQQDEQQTAGSFRSRAAG